MKKLFLIIVCILLLVAASVYLYTRYQVLKAKDFKPDKSRAKNVLDLRPTLIAKLQQLVKDGSDGLYVLSIERLNADVISSKLDIINVAIGIDTVVMKNLDSLKKLPDDVFKIRFDSLHIDGIGIEDLLNKKQIDVEKIYCSQPIIEVLHKLRPYNKVEREARDSLSLYQKIKGQVNSIRIGEINIGHGNLINKNVSKKSQTRFNDVTISMRGVLIDSSTENDRKRFLFAKHAIIKSNNLNFPTADSLYFFKVGSISVLGEQHKIIASRVELKPRGDKKQFPRKVPVRKERYDLAFPNVILNNVDWYSLLNHEKVIAEEIELNSGSFDVFLDRTPPPHAFKSHNFPHQVLKRLPFPLSISRLRLNNIDVSYEEVNPDIKKSATAYFDNVIGTMTNISNLSEDIKKGKHITFSGKGLFMHKVPMTGKFSLDLAKYKTGDFTADLTMDTLENTTINPIAETLSLFSVKKGQMQHASAHVEGNNVKAKGVISFYYTNLHITPLKKDSADDGKLKKKTFTSFFANTFLIKNSNPRNGDFRRPVYYVDRETRPNFFNFIWVTILTGICKTIGIPPKFVVR